MINKNVISFLIKKTYKITFGTLTVKETFDVIEDFFEF